MGKVTTAFCLIVSFPSRRLPAPWPVYPFVVERRAGRPKTIDGSPSLPPPGSDPVPFRPCRHSSDLLARRATAVCIMQLGSLAKRTGVAGWHGTKKLRCGWDPSPGRWRMNGSVSYRLALTRCTSHPLPSAWAPVTQPRRFGPCARNLTTDVALPFCGVSLHPVRSILCP